MRALQRFVKAGRVFETDRDNGDILIYLLWTTGSLSNIEIGELYGVSYSAITHAVSSLKIRVRDYLVLATKFDHFYSQFKLCPSFSRYCLKITLIHLSKHS